MTTFNLPDLGEGLTEATLLSWLVAEGEDVQVDQAIAEVETAKSAIEVPSPYAGTVHTLHGAVGETLEVGKPLITVTTSEDGSNGTVSPSEAGALSYREEERAGTAVPENAEAEEGSGNVLIGYGTSASTNGRRRRRKRDGGRKAPTPAPAVEQTKAPRVSSPLVRKMARELGLDLGSVNGSGPDGLIMRRDIRTAVDQSTQGQSAADLKTLSGRSGEASPEADHDSPTGLHIRQRVPMTGMRRAIANKMSQSRTEIPEATVWQDVDVTQLTGMRQQLKDAGHVAPSILAFLSRFVVAGLQKYPELNSRVVDTGNDQEIIHFEGVNLGFAAQTEAGLVVPVIRHAEQHSAQNLHHEIRRMAEAAREGGLGGKELSGGTFTVNNYGVFGSDGATPIINHPEAGILGIGRTLDRPWVVNGEIAVRKITTLTLAFDHRVCDGGAAGGFLGYVASCLENPAVALADF
ncbi:dihydrolipoamide acetyltransferase family protein [Nesterenkonia natronophila]|uniref:Dihydrolipoamide acetyltransferase component of pyruvate dehydrogenase complex n=1 Tax=Nesterenkonia natronophila TaxID=2174932 RepID=A0A3A4FK99_9MICC|nr:dihydrolipoamide acetyltransferase family protein [Nesterenkonia natronophila]RJN32825.1 2-oxo acid dehydrogenase subunit E2 [Nesterenkonia natronophila]